ncbi:torsin-1A-like [Montipora capricornis]|uniref:torsin-1A-like n=1 Tax=Montipora capricornis TaxID=246305 RepID=UPI0035F1CBE8
MAVQESCRGISMNDSLYRERRQEGWSTESGSSTDEDATLTAPLVTDLDYLDFAMDLIRKNIENLSMNDSLCRERRQEGWSTESGSSTDEDATLTAPLVTDLDYLDYTMDLIRKNTENLSIRDDDKEKLTRAAKAVEDMSHKKRPLLNQNGFLTLSLFFVLGALLLSFYLHANPHGFCLESEFSKNISGIGDTLKAELYGQHVAQKIITVALNHFRKNNVRKPLVFSFHGWTGTGKTFVSNIITEHIFKRKMQSPFVHKFIVPLHFPHESEVNTYNEQLKGWIRGNVSHCRKGALFIFDEMDKIHSGMMDTIKDAILDYRGKSTTAGYQNMVFIFLSNSGGQAINDHVLRHVFEGKIRESLTSSELENIFHGVIENTPDIWFADLLKEDVIDHLVPFLPLERMHVKQCIRRDLIKKGFAVEETMVKNIADQMDYFPRGHNFFSVSGCKKVSSRVDVIMG